MPVLKRIFDASKYMSHVYTNYINDLNVLVEDKNAEHNKILGRSKQPAY